MEGWFVDPAGGNLRLRSPVAEVVDRGLKLPAVEDDIDGRRRGSRPDLGASEYARQ
jgi:hypothetical protein